MGSPTKPKQIDLKQLSHRLFLDAGNERKEHFNLRCGQHARILCAQPTGQGINRILQNRKHGEEHGITGIPAHLGHSAQSPDCAQLFQYIGIVQ